jgi:hypothetical protein
MSNNFDFEKFWSHKFSTSLKESVNEKQAQIIMDGSEFLSQDTEINKKIEWTKKAMENLDTLKNSDLKQEIMTKCGCQYPQNNLDPVIELYKKTHSVVGAHKMLQQIFQSFLKKELNLDPILIKEIKEKGWGLAGILKENTIIATKIPKSGNLKKYFREKDFKKKRALYCHCPRIRNVVKTSEIIPYLYCYCGAGFYKGIWERILGKQVRVEVLKSVLKGDNVCTIKVHLFG